MPETPEPPEPPEMPETPEPPEMPEMPEPPEPPEPPEMPEMPEMPEPSVSDQLKATMTAVVTMQSNIEELLQTLQVQQTEGQQAHTARVSALPLQSATEKRMYMMAVDMIYFRRQTLMTVERTALEKMFHLTVNRVYGDCYRLYRMVVPQCNQFPTYDTTSPLAQYERTLLMPLLTSLLTATAAPAAEATGTPGATAVMNRCLQHAMEAQHTANQLLLQCCLDTLGLHRQGLEHIYSQLKDVHHLARL